MQNFYWPLPIIIGLVVLLTGLIAYVQSPSRRENQLFFLETVIVCVWAIANSMVILNWQSPELILFWDRLTYTIGFPIAPVFALFSCYLSKPKTPPKLLLASSFISSFLIIYIPLGTNMLHGLISEDHTPNQIYLILYCLAFLGFVAYGLRNLQLKFKVARNPLEKRQLRILRMGLVVAFTTGISSGIVAPIFAANTWVLNIFTVFATFIFSIFTGYAVIKHGFMGPLPFAMDQIFENFYGGIIVTDYDGTIIKSNPALRDMLSLTESMEGKNYGEMAGVLASLIEKGQREEFKTWFLGDAEGEKEITFGKRWERLILATKSAVKDSRGEAIGRIYTFLDGTERKKLTRELQESRDHLSGLLENANDIIITCDKTGKIMSANKMALELSGFGPEKWKDQNIFDIIKPEFLDETRQWASNHVLGRQAPPVLTLEFVGADEERIPVEASLNLIESNGEVVGVQAIARDLRPRLKAEHQINELQILNEQIIRNATTGIATFDKNGFFTSVNPAYAQILGLDSPENLLRRNFFDLPTTKKYHHGQNFAKVLKGDTVEGTYEFHVVEAGKDVSLRVFATPLKDESGIIQGALIILADFTRQRELEKQLIQSEKLSSIGKLISGVAHELNNPLTAIMGYSQLLSIDVELSDKTLDIAQKIQTSAERCKKIVENLLSFARSKPPEKIEVNINELLDQTLELREYDLRVSNIGIIKTYAPELRLTAGDPDQLQQVFLNLINNAFDAMYESNGRGVLEIRTFESRDNFINIEFLDDGPGVEESIRDRIFDPFITTKSPKKGTGLGLSLSYGIIQSHGGSLILDARYSAGAKFIVKIPVEPVEPKSEAPVRPTEESSVDGSKHILLVDDEKEILECTKLLLERHLFQVTTAASGEEAKKLLDHRAFDVIVTDLRMPGSIDGQTLYRLVREESPELAAKMIFITGDTVDIDTEKFLNSVSNRHVKKPFTSQELISSVTATIEI